MHDIEVISASSIGSAFEKAIRFIDKWAYQPSYCWFRGVKNHRLSLQPGAYWRKKYYENEALVDFVQKGVAFGKVGTLEDWDTYYLAQHHGIPTRLLDWTESFGAALFFALNGWNGRTTPAIWILQPALLNETFLGWHGVLVPGRESETNIWLPTAIAQGSAMVKQDREGYTYDNRWPLAILPKWTNRRVAAQQGVFTVHGREKKPLPELIKSAGKKPADHLAILQLCKLKRPSVHRELSMLGIRRSAVFPDMDNFVREIKEQMTR